MELSELLDECGYVPTLVIPFFVQSRFFVVMQNGTFIVEIAICEIQESDGEYGCQWSPGSIDLSECNVKPQLIYKPFFNNDILVLTLTQDMDDLLQFFYDESTTDFYFMNKISTDIDPLFIDIYHEQHQNTKLIIFDINQLYILNMFQIGLQITKEVYTFKDLQYQYSDYDITLWDFGYMLAKSYFNNAFAIQVMRVDEQINQGVAIIQTYNSGNLPDANMKNFTFKLFKFPYKAILIYFDYDQNQILQYDIFNISNPIFSRKYSLFGSSLFTGQMIFIYQSLLVVQVRDTELGNDDDQMYVYDPLGNSIDNLIAVIQLSNIVHVEKFDQFNGQPQKDQTFCLFNADTKNIYCYYPAQVIV